MSIVKIAGNTTEVDNPHAMISDGEGSYLALGETNRSNYDGWQVLMDDYYKVVHNLLPESPLKSLNIQKNSFHREFDDGNEQSFRLVSEGLLVRVKGKFKLTLDCKKRFDEDESNRHYDIKEDEDGITVTYDKKGDYRFYVHIRSECNMLKMGEWVETSYSYDERRGTSFTPWVYEALQIEGEGMVAISTSTEKIHAKERTKMILDSDSSTIDEDMVGFEEVASRSLETLYTPTGILAGIPWFTQEWSRDELVSLGGVISIGDYSRAVAILDKWYGILSVDGRLPAMYPDEGLESSDAPGWLAKRTSDLISALRNEGKLILIQKKIKRWCDIMGMLCDTHFRRMENGLIWSGTNTTWMDTDLDDGGRAGARIEIQALTLAIYDCHSKLARIAGKRVPPHRNENASRLWSTVNQRLVHNNILLDGLDCNGFPDWTVRPNIFLAYYLSPRLFSKGDWKVFFDHALSDLWCEWGGLSSIDRSSNKFHGKYTGEDSASYHRGDSWYWVNNIAAISMKKLDQDMFKTPIEKITEASMRDLLSMGYIGHLSEISSADKQEACGCHSQAWSISTLLELLED